ncbi:MAG: glutamate-cysteine ligase family protein [Syntrophotaleaceae bacterium]
MTTMLKTGLDHPVTGVRDLVDYLKSGARPPEKWGVGVEMEKLVLDVHSGEAVALERIEVLFERLASLGPWKRIHEQGRLIALRGPDSSVTLEPGGQLELSGALCPDLYCCLGDFCRYAAQIVEQAESLGLLFLGLGVQPFSNPDDIGWLPKARYDIMRSYMSKTGDMGHRMMKQSAGLQVNLDFSDEQDCIEKMRVAQWLSPLFYALFANSPIMDDRPTGFLSTRGEIWSRTDPDRTGLLLGLFAGNADLGTYAEYALDVPMYFIHRQGRMLDMTGERFSFRRYLAEGFDEARPTLADWDLHLSTLFPEVRLRPQIELRSADSLPPRLALAVAALAKGLLYDRESRRAVASIFEELGVEKFLQVYRNSWKMGLKTPFGNRTLREVTLDILSLARDGLRRQHRQGLDRPDESQFLDQIGEIAESGLTLAERLLAGWQGSRAEKLSLLREHCGYSFCS